MLVGTSKVNVARYTEIDQVVATSILTEDEKCAAIASIIELQPTAVNQVYYAGNTAMHLAAKYALPEVTKLLIKLNFPINIKNDRGLTPLHCAAEANAPVVLLILCHQLKIEINTVDSKNESALHKAARAKSAECLKILVSQSTLNLTIRNLDGKTAQDIVEMDYDAARKASLLTVFKTLPVTNSTMPEFQQRLFESLILETNPSGLKDLRKKFSELQLEPASIIPVSPVLGVVNDNSTLKTNIIEPKEISQTKRVIPEDLDFILGDKAKIEIFLKEGGDPNQIILPHQMPLIYSAFIYKKKALFIQLIVAGASLHKHDVSQHMHSVLARDQEGSHAEFLLAIVRELYPIVKNEIAAFDVHLQKHIDTVHNALIADRFVERFPTHDAALLEEEFFTDKCQKAIYFICSGVEKGNYRVFESVHVSKCTLGLLDKFSPDNVLNAIRTLAPRLKNAQRQICLYILKEMLIYNIDFSYGFGDDFKKNLHAYLQDNTDKDLQQAMLRLFEYITAFKQYSIFERYHAIQKMISFYPFKSISHTNQLQFSYNSEELEVSAWRFSIEIRNITLQFFQLVDLKEFRNDVWGADKPDRIYNSPTMIAHERALEKVREYITGAIMAQKSPQDRVKAFIYFLHVAKKCLISAEDAFLDFNAIMTVLGGIDNCSKEDLTEIMVFADKKTKKMYQQLSNLRHPRDNFKYARHLMHCQPLPLAFLPVFLKDKEMLKTHAAVANLSGMGELYLPILQLKRKIKILSNTFDNALLFQAGVKIDETVERSDFVNYKSDTKKLKNKLSLNVHISCVENNKDSEKKQGTQHAKPITLIYTHKKECAERENTATSDDKEVLTDSRRKKQKIKRYSSDASS